MITQGVVIAVVLAMSSRASADTWPKIGPEGDCPDGQLVTGRCGGFGLGFRPPFLRLELGMVTEQRGIEATAATDGNGLVTGTLANDQILEGRGLSVRALGGYRGVYLGTELVLSRIGSPPRLGLPPSGIVPPHDTDVEDDEGVLFMPNTLSSLRLVVGFERRVDRLILGAELGIGATVINLGGREMGDPYLADVDFALDARARAGIWLTRNLTISAIASKGLVGRDQHMFGLMIGGSAFAWDGL